MRYYVISDVHGYYTQMKSALEKAGFFSDTTPHKLIMLGDLFDRGHEAKQLQQFILEQMEQDKIILIRGNHEDLFVELVTTDAGMPYSCYEMTFFNRKSQRTFTCQIVQNTKRHLKRAKTMQISGIGHSVIRGLVTTGQWFSASTTVYPRGSPQGRRHSYFVDC